MSALNPRNSRLRASTFDPADLAELASNRPRRLLLPRELSDDEFGLFRTAGKLREVKAGELV
jgi:hypothetical protein